jgi:hypothetical protein
MDRHQYWEVWREIYRFCVSSEDSVELFDTFALRLTNERQ